MISAYRPPFAFSRRASLLVGLLPLVAGAQSASPPPDQEPTVSLEKYEVEGRRPFTDENVDVVRTMNDVQPYFIFNAVDLDRSGALNVEDFLKTRLTMNTEAGTIAEGRTVYGGSTSINFNGLGTSQTLILIDGRRLPAEILAGSPHQPPLNGVPLAAIDHIDVLPSSASAIYGGGATAGVVNVILKHNYNGGELSFTYDNTFVSRTPAETVDLTAGFSGLHDRLHVLVTGHFSDQVPLTFADRPFLTDDYYRVAARNPAVLRYTLYDFATPNITSAGGNLTLKNGTALGSTFTSISTGTGPTTGLASQLVANAGTYNSLLPANGGPFGGYPNVLQAARNKMVRGNVGYDLTPWLEAFIEASTASYAVNLPESSPIAGTVPATSPINPFQQAVTVTFPSAQIGNLSANNVIDIVTAGLKAHPSPAWDAELDYTWSADNLFSHNDSAIDSTALNAALAAGTINPFVDTLQYPIDLRPYREPVTEGFPATLNDVGARVSNQSLQLPAGAVHFIGGVEHRKEGVRDGYLSAWRPLEVPLSTNTVYLGNSQSNDAVFAEAQIPVFASSGVMRHAEVQAAGRYDAYAIGSGTASATQTPNATPPGVTYSPATAAPFHTTVHYHSANPTAGLKVDLAGGVTLRASYSSAFLPPTIAQLTPNPQVSTSLTTITDPVAGKTYGVQTLTGGNPALTPQTAKDWDTGLIFAPSVPALQGLRFDLEFYHIEETNVIGTLTAQQLVNLQGAYPSRLTRDPASGLITVANISSLNLYRLVTQGWTGAVNYDRPTGWGTWNVDALATFIPHYGQQVAPGAPLLEYAGYANDGGPAKLKGSASLSWSRGPFLGGWTTTYFSSYYQSGAPGSPLYADNPNATLIATYLLGQGNDAVPSQVYHDVFAGYRWRMFRLAAKLEIGVKDLFNTAPPLDAYNLANSAPYSYYGDARLRHYWVRLNLAY